MLNLHVLTPEKEIYNGEVNMVVVPSVEGQLGILPKHTNLFAQLTEGELRIKAKDKETELSIGGGFVKVSPDKTIVLVTRAVKADELNEVAILAAKEEAERALKEKRDPNHTAMYQSILRQSLVDMKLIRKMRRQGV